MPNKTIPIIDLFAGPGGLAEGFCRYSDVGGVNSDFDALLSVEKDPWAHQTLQLRGMYRSLVRSGDDLSPYWQYVRVADQVARSGDERDQEARTLRQALRESAPSGFEEAPAPLELGKDNARIFELISERLGRRTNWVLLGGPPCQAYSLVGRSRISGGRKFAADVRNAERFSSEPRHKLYEQYLRVVARFTPAVFVMENVKGMLSSTHGVASGTIAEKIMTDLSAPTEAVQQIDPLLAKDCEEANYDLYSFVAPPEEQDPVRTDLFMEPVLLKANEARDFVIRAERHGVPQARHRVILLGIRREGRRRKTPWQWRRIGAVPLSKDIAASVAGAIQDLPPLRSRLSRQEDSHARWSKAIGECIQPLLEGTGALDDADLKRLLEDNLRKLSRARSLNFAALPGCQSGSVSEWMSDPWVSHWYEVNRVYGSDRLSCPVNHRARSHMSSDLGRYLFAATRAQLHSNKPLKVGGFPPSLLPAHANVKSAGNDAPFADRFRVQRADRPSTTIMSHISKDGHYYIHPDPVQARSLTVREAARLQTFPDSYFFEGRTTQQYHQVGNAVPPMLAFLLAETVSDALRRLFLR